MIAARITMHRSLWAAAVALAAGAAAIHAEPPLHIEFPSGLPDILTPDQPHEIAILITDGTQTVVPGTPTAHYRIDSSEPFTALPLQHGGGSEWTGALPGMPCGNALDLYFSAEGDGGATVFLPAGAPAEVFSTTIAFVRTAPLHETVFDISWPAGWSATGIWHVNAACAPVGNVVAGCEQGPYAYFGRAATCNYNLPIGTPHILYAPAIELPQIPTGGRIILSFCYALETSEHEIFDRAEVFINGSTRAQWRLPDVRPSPGQPDRFWSTGEIDMTEFAGDTVSVSWRFSNIMTPTDYRGWHINDVRIIADVLSCEAPCYANCDGSTTPPILNVDDFTCFINQFAAAQLLPHTEQIEHYANCDGSTVAPVLNVDDFTCFINAFAAGCS